MSEIRTQDSTSLDMATLVSEIWTQDFTLEYGK